MRRMSLAAIFAAEGALTDARKLRRQTLDEARGGRLRLRAAYALLRRSGGRGAAQLARILFPRCK
ncbi:unknown [Prevotella sp. CAG:1031]|nr:unknown [Prevotella sp. CAG:1031]